MIWKNAFREYLVAFRTDIFTISQTKLVSYILPMFPALAIVIGWNIARMQKKIMVSVGPGFLAAE